MKRPGMSAAKAARLALAAAIGAALALQVQSGLWSVRSWDLLVGVTALAGAAAAPLVLREGRGTLPGLGMTAVAVAHAFVTASRRDGTSLLLVLVLWLPAVVLGLVFNDDAQRLSGPASWRPWLPHPPLVPGRPQPAGPPVRRRLVMSGLAAAAILGVLSTLAVEVVKPPTRGGMGRREADRFWDSVARSGRSPTSLGIYQSSDQLDVGRRFKLSDQVVMKVRAASPDFWRGTSYDSWDGRIWTRTPLGAGVDDPSDRGLPSGQAIPAVDRQNLLQVFTMVAGGSDLLFGAYRAVQYVPPDTRPHTQPDGTTSVARPLGPGARYAVISSRPVVDAETLRRADPLGNPLPGDISARYLALPDVPTRVLDLARHVTAGQPTAFDKIKALEGWIGAHTTYTLDIPPLPAGADAVDQFLFVDRRGFCEQIATSLAVMLRSVGVPARLGVGYAPGQRTWGSDEFVVRARDAHAWVEVWFPGVGWQAFDPTSSVPLSGERSPSARARLAPWVVGAAVAASVIALAWTLVRRTRRRRAMRWETALLSRFEAAGARRGRPRHPSETATEYLRALGEGALADPRLHEVAVVLTRAAYGPDQPDEVERRRIQQLADEILEKAPAPERRRLPVTAGR